MVHLFLGGKSPYELFSLFFDDQVVNMIVNYSNEYATQSNSELALKPFELQRFIGILFLTGYHVLPHWKMYWGQDHNGLPIVKQAFPRSRFYSIKRYIHLSDNNNLDKNDKFSKIRPVYDVANEKFMQFGVFAHNLSIDEQMIPYFGRHSCKMFIRGKPIRFGFKAWCLCSSDGYLYQTILYGGASTPHDKTIGLGADVILTLLKNVTDPVCHRVFFDNFFTSYHLMCLLNERRFFGTGTVRSNRIGGAKLPEKLEKGKYQALFDQNQELLTVRWRDNSNVTVLTNHLNVEPIAQARRYDRKAKKHIHIPMPGLIKEYNTYMGGVDLHDNALANYRIGIRGKKWWWPLFTNLLGNMMVNAWKLHTLVSKCNKTKALSQLEFRIEVAKSLMLAEEPHSDNSDNGTDDDLAEAPRNLPNVNVPQHVIAKNPTNKRKRCAVCHSQTITLCKKCNVHLHSKCFEHYSPHKK